MNIEENLLKLSHDLGQESRKLAILGEGNTSAVLNEDTFMVKASGSCLGNLTKDGLATCSFDKLLPMLKEESLTDQEVDDGLLNSRLSDEMKKPSVEATFHAYLLSLPGVEYVGHTHPVSVNQILCTQYARDFAEKRLFPDQIVCCGAESVFVPYTDPGLELAKAIQTSTEEFVDRTGRQPVTLLIENHGLVALGRSAAGVLAATLMAAKSAEIFAGALAAGDVKYLTPEQVERIAGRPDEHYRQKMLNL